MGGVRVGEGRNKKDLLARIKPIPWRQIDALVAFPPSHPPEARRQVARDVRRADGRSLTGITARAGAVQIRTAVRRPREFDVDRRRPVRLGPVVLARRRVRQAVVVGLVAVRSFIINDAELHFQV